MQLKIDELLNSGRDLIEKNMPVILTGVGVVGTVTTAVLTGRASFKASETLSEEMKQRDLSCESTFGPAPLTTQEKVKLVWPLYIPPALSGTGTVAAIIMANRASASQAAVLAAAYGLSEKRLEEYKGKVSEKLTKNKATEINDEIAQDRVNKNPPNGNITQGALIIASGEVLCQDSQTGRYFTNNVESINRRLNELNNELINHDYASVGWFFDGLGLPPTNVTNELGWNHANDGLIDLALSTVLVNDEKPCVVVDFQQQPHLNYNIRSYA